MRQGELIGRVQEARRTLLKLLAFRFPDFVTPQLEQTINQQCELSVLDDWFEAALRASSAEDLKAVPRH